MDNTYFATMLIVIHLSTGKPHAGVSEANSVFQVVGTLFMHHQKCVTVDTQATGNNRKITAFIGGLDLCDGRYDTPEHRLFKDLDTVFKDDFHNPTFPVSSLTSNCNFPPKLCY